MALVPVYLLSYIEVKSLCGRITNSSTEKDDFQATKFDNTLELVIQTKEIIPVTRTNSLQVTSALYNVENRLLPPFYSQPAALGHICIYLHAYLPIGNKPRNEGKSHACRAQGQGHHIIYKENDPCICFHMVKVQILYHQKSLRNM